MKVIVMKSVSIAAVPPEFNKLWLIQPEILLMAEVVYADERDVKRIFCLKERSSLDYLLANLLEAYLNENLIQVVDYGKSFPSSKRMVLRQLAENLIDSDQERALAVARYVYPKFCDYLRSKVTKYEFGEPLQKETFQAYELTRQAARELSSQQLQVASKAREVLVRLIMKWLCLIYVAKEMGTLTVYETDEYAEIHRWIVESSVCDTAKELQPFFTNKDARSLELMYKFLECALPRIEIKDGDGILKVLRPKRHDFQKLRELLRQIQEICQTISDDAIIMSCMVSYLDQVGGMLKRQMTKGRGRLVSEAVHYVIGSMASQETKSDIKREELRQLATEAEKKGKIKPPFGWIAYLREYGEPTGWPQIRSRIQRETIDTDIEHAYWITGAPTPWFARGDDNG